MFDDCKDNWGDKMCYWQEDPVDELDWIIAHGKSISNMRFLHVSIPCNYFTQINQILIFLV